MKTWKTPKGTELPLLNLKGKDYLAVQWRLVWFREEKPDWSIETVLDQIPDSCVAKATIKDPSGRIISTAHKHENKQGFEDFREKAETGSIGRALALIGYGTQFCADELDEGRRIADAPADRGHANRVVPEQPMVGDGVQAPAPTCDCGTILKFTKSNKSGMYPDGCWYCPSFKNKETTHTEPMQPEAYERYKTEILAHELAKQRENEAFSGGLQSWEKEPGSNG
jgi:hypothetical protein